MPPLNTHPNAHPASGAYTNAAEVSYDLIQVGVRAQSKGIAVTKHHAMLLETRVKARASGRPGPRAKTGDYRASWTTQFYFQNGVAGATVGTNKPQGRRLEHGFVGADRIGRVYNQPPFPHLGPAVDETRPGFEHDMANVVSWGGTR